MVEIHGSELMEAEQQQRLQLGLDSLFSSAGGTMLLSPRQPHANSHAPKPQDTLKRYKADVGHTDTVSNSPMRASGGVGVSAGFVSS